MKLTTHSIKCRRYEYLIKHRETLTSPLIEILNNMALMVTLLNCILTIFFPNLSRNINYSESF
jgi:predicted nucleic-acid-binding Zn-ribbon protein